MLLDKIYKLTLTETCLNDIKDKRFLLAISGGLDSIFLYHIYRKMSKKYGFTVSLAHVNYNTNNNSLPAMNLCLNIAKKYHNTIFLKNCFLKEKVNFESRARELRYDMFRKIKNIEKYDYILTAHHRGDLVETLYMQNKSNISVIPFSNSQDKIIRPLLNIDRSDIQKYVDKYKYDYVEDLTNLDRRFKRNHIRLEVLPSYSNQNLIESELFEVYDFKKKAMDRLRYIVKKQKHRASFNKSLNRIKIKRNNLELKNIYATKLIIQSLLIKYMDIKVIKTQKYWKSLHQKIIKVDSFFFEKLSADVRLFCDTEYLYLFKKKIFVSAKKMKNGSVWLNNAFRVYKGISNINNVNNKNIFICPKDMYNKGLTIRKWINGDRFDLPTGGRKKVSDLFNDSKISLLSRKERPIVLNDDRIEWIPGLAHSKNNYKNDNHAYLIEWIPNE